MRSQNKSDHNARIVLLISARERNRGGYAWYTLVLQRTNIYFIYNYEFSSLYINCHNLYNIAKFMYALFVHSIASLC